MLISDSFLTKEIRATDDYKEYETMFVNVAVPMNQPQPVVSTQGTHRSTPRAHRIPSLTNASPLGKKRKQREKDVKSYADKFDASMIHDDDDDDSSTRIESGSHKEHLEVVDDDDNKEEKKYDKEGDEISSLETRTEKMCASQDVQMSRIYDQGYGKKVSEVPALISKEFDTQAPQIIEELFKNYVQNNVIQVHPTTTTSTKTTSSTDPQQQLYLKMKSNPQDQANDLALWNVLKRNFEKSSTFNTSCRDDEFHSQQHDDHQEDDAPPEGEKRVKRHKTSKSSKSARGSSSKQSAKDSTAYVSKQQQEWDAWEEETIIDEDEVIPKDETPELITEFQNVDKRVPTIFDRATMEVTLNDMLSNQFRNAEENPNEPPRYLYNKDLFFLKNGNTEEKKYILSLHKIHAEIFLEADLKEKMNLWVQKEVKNFNEDSRLIIKVVRITTDQQYGLDYMEKILVMRENDKPDSFSEADFKYLKKNDIEDLYYLCQNKKVNYRETMLMNSFITFTRSRVIWERVHDFELGIESYQINVNLTAPTLTFPGIEAHEPYSIVDKPHTDLIYLNSQDEKQFWKKPPLLSELDLDIMKAFKREISKRLSHRQQMRRWESFVNGRPILPTMKHL
ncbi:hypothetical protein Tco_0432606 [Tanacetum coccineum]